MKNRFLTTTALAGLAFFAATPAFAACDIHNPSSGQTVTCSGSDTTSVSNGSATGVTVNYADNSSINTSNQLYINLGSGAIINTGANSTFDAPSADGMSVGANSIVNIGAGTSLSSGNRIIDVQGTGVTINIGSGASVNGSVHYMSGTAGAMAASIDGTIGSMESQSNNTTLTVTLLSGYNVTNNITGAAGGGTDTLILGGTANGSLDTDEIDDASGKFRDFDLFEKSGASTWTLSGATAKSWTIHNGVLSVAAGNIGNAAIDSAGTLLFNNKSGGYSGTLTGAGTVSLTNSADITLGGTNTGFTGKYILAGGSSLETNSAGFGNATELDLDNGTLVATGNMTTNANVVLGAGNGTINTDIRNVTINGIVSGTGHTLTMLGDGVLTLSGANTYGNTVLNGNGSLSIGAGNNLGTGAITFQFGQLQFTNDLTLNNAIDLTAGNDGAFNVTGSHVVTLAGAISANGGHDLVTTGTGILRLTGDASGISGGRLLIAQSGTLLINNDMTGYTGAYAPGGGTIGGTGLVNTITVDGNLAPGDGPGNIGTLHIGAGGMLFDPSAGAHYIVDYNASTADNVIAQGGGINISSGNVLELHGTGAAGAYALGKTYVILEGDSVNGTFDTVTNDLAFIGATQINTGTQLLVQMLRNDVTFDAFAQNPTQKATADAIEDLGPGNDVYDAYASLPTDEVPQAAENLSGSSTLGTTQAAASNFTNATIGHILQVTTSAGASHTQQADNSDPSVYNAAFIEPSSGAVSRDINIWMQAIGGIGHSLANGATPGQKRNMYGAIGGIDRTLDDVGMFGIYAGYQKGEIASDAVGSSSDIDSWQLGAYASRPITGGFNLSGGFSAIYHDINTVRHVFVGASSFSPHGSTNGNTITGFVEADHPLFVSDMNLTGFGTLAVTRNHGNGYTETDGGDANLVVGDTTKTNPSATLGLRGSKIAGDANIDASLGWQHTFGDVENDATMRFAGGTTTFESVGTPIARDAAVVGLKTSTRFASGMSAYAGYDGTLARDAQDHSFKLGMKINF